MEDREDEALIRKISEPSKEAIIQSAPGFIFIDANQYLNLYSVIKGKQLLNLLIEQKERIFVTAQIVDEVQRNKLNVAKRFLEEHFNKLDVVKFIAPDHLFDVSEATATAVHHAIDPIAKNIEQIKKALREATSETLDRISKSQDEASTMLDVLFKGAITHTSAELDRARARRERGNPPGKHRDFLGDQISWEQVLSHYKASQKLWLITHDSDFCLEREGKSILNPFLYKELAQVVGGTPEVYCFSSINDGIKHFASQTGVAAKTLPNEQESKEIKAEWDSANSVVSTSTSALSINVADFIKATDSYLQYFTPGARKNAIFYRSTGQEATPLPLIEADEQTPPKSE